MKRLKSTFLLVGLLVPTCLVLANTSTSSSSLTQPQANVSLHDPHRSGYHHQAHQQESSVAPHHHHHQADGGGQKTNQFPSSSGFVPIAKPLIQDIYDVSSSERAASHLHRQQDPDNSSSVNHESAQGQDDQYHRYFSNQNSYDNTKNDDGFRDYGYSPAHHVDHYYDENQARPDHVTRNNYYNKYHEQDHKYGGGNVGPVNDDHSPDLASESDPYGGKSNYGKPHRPYSMYSDEQSMFHPDSAVHMLKNIAQPSDYPTSSLNEPQQSPSEHDLHNLMGQYSGPSGYGLGLKGGDSSVHPLAQDFAGATSNDFPAFSDLSAAPPPMSGINGIAGFQPAPEGGQLPAPPGYKHVGYITIPAGAANLPNMMSQPGNGLPIIRPIPINGGEMGKLNKDKMNDGKKNGDNKASESKPVRSFLSRFNPLNMLRRLRQRRERRQTTDMSANDYLPMSSKYSSNYAMPPSSYSVPYGGYGSLSGLGGMSGIGSMYGSVTPMYSMPYGSAYSGYSSGGYSGGYSGYPAASYGYAMSPGMSAYQTKSPTGGDLGAAASAVSGAAMSPPSMPMMMPYGGSMPGYGSIPGYGSTGGYGATGGYPMSMPSMPMPYGYGPSPMLGSAGSSSSSSSSSSGEGDQNNPLGGQTLPGGLNLSDLLKDEEDEPSRFRKFLGYLNPMNLIKRFRNNTSEERKRFGREKRDVKFYMLTRPQETRVEKRSDEEVKSSQAILADKKALDAAVLENGTEYTADPIETSDEADADAILARDTMPKVTHDSWRKGSKRNKYNLMGSRNFEVLRGGTFQVDEMVPLTSSRYEHEHPLRGGNGNVLADSEELFSNDSPEILGFQGFNGFSSLYNSLSASSKSPKYSEPSEAPPAQKSEQPVEQTSSSDKSHSFQSIEHAAINYASSDLKAVA